MASSKRFAAQANNSAPSSPAPPPTSTSSPTTSTSTPKTVVIALGSNLGNRALHLARALHALGSVVRLVRISSIHETEPVNAPPPRYLNMVVVGYTHLSPSSLLAALLDIERTLGRVRPARRNAPRTIDLDLIAYSGVRMRTRSLTLPHPRALERTFVMEPWREVSPVQSIS